MYVFVRILSNGVKHFGTPSNTLNTLIIVDLKYVLDQNELFSTYLSRPRQGGNQKRTT